MKRIIFLCFLLPALSVVAQDAGQWQAEMDAFKKADSVHVFSPGGIVFTGSSSIRMWKTLAEDFPNKRVLNRGFGGSTIADALKHFDQVAGKYKPSKIVLYAGDNDVSNGKSVEDVFTDFKQFVHKIKQTLPGTELYYLSIKPSISRWHLWEKMDRVNQLVKAYAAKNKGVTFVDVSTPMLEGGKPNASLFLDDGLHMNEKGYRIWTGVLRPQLK